MYTGSDTRSRVAELVEANPGYPMVRASGHVGTPKTFDPEYWLPGLNVNLPPSWSGQVGQEDQDIGKQEEAEGGYSECSNGVISDVKEYRYELQADDSAGLGALAVKWGLPSRRWLEISKANSDIPHKLYGQVCEPDRTKLWEGRLLKIPKTWPDPPESLWSRLKNPDGTPYTPGGGTGGGGGGGEGTDGIDPAKWYGTDGGGSYIWPILIIGAAVLGGVVLVGASKKKGARK